MRRSVMVAPVVALVTGAVIAGGTAPAGATTAAVAAAHGDWTQAGADAGWSRYQAATGGLGAARAGRLGVGWAQEMADSPAGAVLAGGRLWVGTSAGSLYAVDPSTGRWLGRVRLGANREIKQLAVVGGTVIVHSSGPFDEAKFLTSYTLRGQRRWEVRLPDGDGVSPFAVDGGRIAINTGPTCHDPCAAYDVRVFRADTGALLWRGPTGGDARFQAPAIVGDAVYQAAEVPGQGWTLIAYDAATGQRRWARPGGGGTAATGGAVYGVSDAGLCAVRPATGTTRWCAPARGRVLGQVGVSPGLVLTTEATRPELIALNPANGRERWWVRFSRDTYRGEFSLPPVSGGGVVYGLAEYFDADNDREFAEVVAVHANSGAVLRRVALPPDLGVAQQLLLGAGHLFVVTDRGVWALG